MFSIAKNTSRVGPNSAAVYVKLSLCPAHSLFTMMKDTVCNFTEETRPDSSVCTCVDGARTRISVCTQAAEFLLSLRLKKKTCFYLLRCRRQDE